MAKRNKLALFLHRNITSRLIKDPAIQALGLISGIKYNLGIAKEGIDYYE